VATERDLHKNIGDVDVYTQFEMLKVKVPIIFLGTVGFSPPREGHYRVFHSLSSSTIHDTESYGRAGTELTFRMSH
jgi:hypothetical protein